MNKQHVRPGRTAKQVRRACVGHGTGNQTFNPLTKEWEHK